MIQASFLKGCVSELGLDLSYGAKLHTGIERLKARCRLMSIFFLTLDSELKAAQYGQPVDKGLTLWVLCLQKVNTLKYFVTSESHGWPARRDSNPRPAA